MSESPEEQSSLGDILHRHGKDPEVEALVTLATEQEHLTSEELDQLRHAEPGRSDAKLDALRQHLVFCPTCNDAFIGEQLRDDEALVPPTHRPERRNRMQMILGPLMLLPLVAAALVWPESSGDESAGTSVGAVTEFAPLKKDAVATLEWIGRGGRDPAPDGARDRLFADIRLASGHEQAHLYLFIVGSQSVALLHPRPAEGSVNPIETGLVPVDGWTFPMRSDHWTGVVGVASATAHPILNQAADRKEVARELERRLQLGAGPDSLLRVLRDLPGTDANCLISIPIYSVR